MKGLSGVKNSEGQAASTSKTTRMVYRPKYGPDGLIVQPRIGPSNDEKAKREMQEHLNRMNFAEHFKYADPYTGNTRTYDERGRYNCGRCNKADSKGCLLVGGEFQIDREAGSCGEWENLCAGDREIALDGAITDEQIAYGVAANGVGFGCKRCPFASKAYEADSRGRSMFCGKGDFRVFPDACCKINGAETAPDNDHDNDEDDEDEKEEYGDE